MDIVYNKEVQQYTDQAFQGLSQGLCGCCITPLFDSIKFTKHQMKLRFRAASCICKPRYLAPWCLAFWITRCNKACLVCTEKEKKASEHLSDTPINGLSPEDTAALNCCIQCCYLGFLPCACIELCCLKATYYSCCMCCEKLPDDKPAGSTKNPIVNNYGQDN